MHVILVPVAGRPESATALDCAFGLAARLEADVVACHVRPHRRMPKKPASKDMLLHYDDNALVEDTPKKIESARKAAQKLFSEHAEAHGYPLRSKPSLASEPIAIWEEFVGSPGRAMAIVGPISDLLVLTRPKTKRSEKAHAFLLAAVLHSGRPVLVLPSRKIKEPPGKRIAIAWNQSREATHAVSGALPLLSRAEEVTIICCGAEDSLGPKSTHLARYLTHWGIDANIARYNDNDTPAQLEQACDEVNADLMVMGAYSRGRLRERLFGGVTEHMLLKSKRAALVMHL